MATAKDETRRYVAISRLVADISDEETGLGVRNKKKNTVSIDSYILLILALLR